MGPLRSANSELAQRAHDVPLLLHRRLCRHLCALPSALGVGVAMAARHAVDAATGCAGLVLE